METRPTFNDYNELISDYPVQFVETVGLLIVVIFSKDRSRRFLKCFE
jgi:hypothetical protein